MVAVIFWWALDGCRNFVMGAGWLPLFPRMALDGCSYFLMGSGWVLVFRDGLGRVVFIS